MTTPARLPGRRVERESSGLIERRGDDTPPPGPSGRRGVGVIIGDGDSDDGDDSATLTAAHQRPSTAMSSLFGDDDEEVCV